MFDVNISKLYVEKKNCDADVSFLFFLPANFLRISTEMKIDQVVIIDRRFLGLIDHQLSERSVQSK